MKKRILPLLLSLCMLVSLTVPALAANTVRSSQKLTVDGKEVTCDIYNIDGSNYFKLRDLASLLNGTGSQFSVGWDNATSTVSIVTGEAYTSVGGELVIGEDKSATATPSTQTILVNGEANSSLSAYNIGGNNFFKLRDLGTAVGFDVDYDNDTRTMLVESVTKRTEAEVFSYIAPEDESLVISDLIFNEPVTVSGDNGSIIFSNCVFNADITNTADIATQVTLDGSCVLNNAKCILKNSVKEGTIETPLPKFTLHIPADAVCEDCVGGVLFMDPQGSFTFNGKSYSVADMELFYDIEAETPFIPYTGQNCDFFVVDQWFENGKQVLYTFGGVAAG